MRIAKENLVLHYIFMQLAYILTEKEWPNLMPLGIRSHVLWKVFYLRRVLGCLW